MINKRNLKRIFIIIALIVLCAFICMLINNRNNIVYKKLFGGEEKNYLADVEHTHIWASKYDSTNHWEYCTVCNQTRNVTAHTWTDHWIYGYASCFEANYSNRTCTCGYTYIYRMPHGQKSGWYTYANGYYHYKVCTACSTWSDAASCTKSDGTAINCGNIGKCSVCNYNYSSVKHIVQNTNGKCSFCQKVMFASSKIESMTYSSDRRTITTIVTIVPNGTLSISGIEATNMTDGMRLQSSNYVKNSDGSYKFTYVTYIYADPLTQASYGYNSRANATVNGEAVRFDTIVNWISATPDISAPAVTSLTQTPQTTTNGWATISKISISGTEDLSDIVYITLKDKENGKVYVDNVAANVSSKKFSYTCTPPLEGSTSGRTYVVSVKDRTGNTSNTEFTVQKMDGAPPTLDSPTSYTNWTTSKKAVTLKFIDYGAGEIQASFGDQNNYKALTTTNGVATVTYEFTTEQNGTSNYDVYVKDMLGNATKYTITVGNIDYTKPVISSFTSTVPDVTQYKVATLKNTATDNISGIKTYYLKDPVGNITSNTTGIFTTTTPGIYTTYVTDVAGNTSDEKTVNVVINYKLTINPNGGIFESKTTNIVEDISVIGTRNLPNPTKAGWTFNGWSVNGIGCTVSNNVFSMGVSDSILVAQWRKVDPDTWSTSKVSTYTDATGGTAPIPIGYTASKVTSENIVGSGLVIYEGLDEVNDSNVSTAQKTRNQWVWVQVPDTSRIYEKSNEVPKSKLYNYASTGRTGYTNDDYEPGILSQRDINSDYSKYGLRGIGKDRFYQKLQIDFNKTIESIEKYGGFYIGRYETGNLSQKELVLQKTNTDIANKSWYEVYSKIGYLEKNSNVEADIIWGSLYDEVMQWLVETGNKTASQIGESSVTWGNYQSSAFTYTNESGASANKTSGTGTIIPTGSSEYTKANNIYDLAGNVWEGTLEGDISYRKTRGGSATETSNVTASCRGTVSPSSTEDTLGASENRGYRAYLYIK